MAKELKITLTGDGSSDRSLLPLIVMLLSDLLPEVAIQESWADLARLRMPSRTVKDRIQWAYDFYPCNLLFVHRDAEKEPHTVRDAEINQAINDLNLPVPVIPVVPVRMLEAWLLLDEAAIRSASGNPNGRMDLSLPNPTQVEADSDPKVTLHSLLRDASGFKGHRLAKYPAARNALLVSDRITSLQRLKQVPSFNRLQIAIAAQVELLTL